MQRMTLVEPRLGFRDEDYLGFRGLGFRDQGLGFKD